MHIFSNHYLSLIEPTKYSIIDLFIGLAHCGQWRGPAWQRAPCGCGLPHQTVFSLFARTSDGAISAHTHAKVS